VCRGRRRKRYGWGRGGPTAAVEEEAGELRPSLPWSGRGATAERATGEDASLTKLATAKEGAATCRA